LVIIFVFKSKKEKISNGVMIDIKILNVARSSIPYDLEINIITEKLMKRLINL
tara:strand:- start:33 stop:191 length:159 start_codon:yes stop_codon:yes gene_type:complete